METAMQSETSAVLASENQDRGFFGGSGITPSRTRPGRSRWRQLAMPPPVRIVVRVNRSSLNAPPQARKESTRGARTSSSLLKVSFRFGEKVGHDAPATPTGFRFSLSRRECLALSSRFEFLQHDRRPDEQRPRPMSLDRPGEWPNDRHRNGAAEAIIAGA